MCEVDPRLVKLGVCIDDFTSHQPFHFLTHAHHDHLRGLSKKWFTRNTNSMIVTTRVTIDLLVMDKPFLKDCFHVVHFNQWNTIKDGLRVFVLSAQHCDGSAMFYFEIDAKIGLLYTGDFRFVESSYVHLKSPDRLFFDDTMQFVDFPIPSLQQSCDYLQFKIAEFPHGPIYIHSNILGIEMLLKALIQREPQITFCISDKLGFRASQIRYLLPSENIDPHSRLQLTTRDRIDDETYGEWILPTSTHFICKTLNPAFKAQKPSNHHYIWFCTHANREEIEQFIAFWKPKEFNACHFAIPILKCLQ